SSDSWAFCRHDSAPGQCIHNIVLRTRNKACLVSVFYADEKSSLVFLRKKVVVQGCAHSTHVQRASGRRGKTNTNIFHNQWFNFCAKIAIWSGNEILSCVEPYFTCSV